MKLSSTEDTPRCLLQIARQARLEPPSRDERARAFRPDVAKIMRILRRSGSCRARAGSGG